MNRNELNLIQSLSQRSEKKPSPTEAAFQKAERIISAHSIKVADFSDLYGKSGIEGNQILVDKKLSGAKNESSVREKESKRYADTLEAMVFTGVDENKWMGPDATPIKTSDYDDIENKVDMVIEFIMREGAAHLALAVDVTFDSLFGHKYRKIEEEIVRGELSKVKYFKSEKMHLRGELKNIPRVVVGIDIKNIREMIKPWIDGNKNVLDNHPIQFLILEEIRLQLKFYKKFAEALGKDKIVDVYNRSLFIVEQIISQKEAEHGDKIENLLGDLGNDRLYLEIKRRMEESNLESRLELI
jgi:hypothetical protein